MQTDKQLAPAKQRSSKAAEDLVAEQTIKRNAETNAAKHESESAE